MGYTTDMNKLHLANARARFFSLPSDLSTEADVMKRTVDVKCV